MRTCNSGILTFTILFSDGFSKQAGRTRMEFTMYARVQRGGGAGGPDPPEKSPKYRVS